MSTTICWDIPSYLDITKEYKIKVYATGGSEDDESGYTNVDDIESKLNGTFISTYTYSGGDLSYYFFLRYYEYPNGNLLNRVLCTVENSIREQRLVRDLTEILPKIIKNQMTNVDRISKDALVQAINSINAYQPETSYSLRNMPRTWEPVIKYGSLIFLLLMLYVGISFKDFSYSDNGLSLNIDRGSKINNAIAQVTKDYDKLVKSIKLNEIDMPIGSGSYALAVPMFRNISFLYNVVSGA